MAGLAVEGGLATTFISMLVNKVRPYIVGNYEFQKEVKEKLKDLEENLEKIQSVIHEANLDNPRLTKWLTKLREDLYDADDVVDLFEYRRLQYQIEGENQVRGKFPSSSRMIKEKGSIVKRFLFPDDDLNDLLAVVKRLDEIVKELPHSDKLVGIDVSSKEENEKEKPYPLGAFIPNEFAVFGRDKEIDITIKQLLKESNSSRFDSNNRFIHVLPIVGVGGVGKTTLAQCVYNSQHVKEHFDVMVWVPVYERFDLKRVITDILLSISSESFDIQNLDSLQQILKRELTGNRFLIVLDDVWNLKQSDWEFLRRPLRFGEEGSRVIITTRDRTLANKMGTMNPLILHGLESEDLWIHSAKYAFAEENYKNHPLESIGRSIAQKLGGSPLAAKMVGAVLQSKLDENYWKSILEAELWDMQQDEDDIVPALKLCYKSLPDHLKQCFCYCSLFPKNYHFEKDKLIQIWIAQGFVEPNDENKMEDIGGEYFDELTRRYFFVKSRDHYVIHDLLHDLAIHFANSEYFRTDVEDTVGSKIPKGVRHLYVESNNLTKVSINKHEMKKLRSLVVVGPCDVDVLFTCLKEMKYLRVLILDRLSMQIFPGWSIDKLLHLRYLELNLINNITKLPESLATLHHLQVLIIKDCKSLQALPEKVSNLTKLQYLSANPKIVSDISGIGKLTPLRKLEFYSVKKEMGHDIGQLRGMTQLTGHLGIQNLENIEKKKEAAKADLKNKAHLESLQLEWSGVSHIKPDEVLDGLQPHQNLRRLKISGYSGTRTPSWLHKKWLSNLEHIHLWECSHWEVLPPLGELPLLKVLHMGEMGGVRRIGQEFYGYEEGTAFPSLEVLSLERMHQWEEWSRLEGRSSFPCLNALNIYKCPKFKGPISLSFSCKQLEICQIYDGKQQPKPSLFQLFIDEASKFIEWLPAEGLSSLQELRISFLSNFASFTNEQEKWFEHLTSLQKLEFCCCSDLQSLPTNLISLSALQVLMIEGCSEIQSLPEIGLPSSLRELYIKNCHPMLKERCKEEGSDWKKIEHIPKIDVRDYFDE